MATRPARVPVSNSFLFIIFIIYTLIFSSGCLNILIFEDYILIILASF